MESTYYNDGNFTSLPSYIFAPRFGAVETKNKTIIVNGLNKAQMQLLVTSKMPSSSSSVRGASSSEIKPLRVSVVM